MATTARSIQPDPRYAALFGTALPRLPGARHGTIRRWREAGFDRFLALGFPGPKTEAWKYTPLGPLARARFELASRPRLSRREIAPYLARGARHLVFVNGYFAAELSDDEAFAEQTMVCSLAAALERGDSNVLETIADADPERALSALNEALAGDGCVIRFGDGVAHERPVQLLFINVEQNPPAVLNPRNVVVLGAGARLDLIESHVIAGNHGFTNLVNQVVLGRGAELRHDRLQIGDAEGTLIGHTWYEISADARLTQSVATLGGALVRNEIRAMIRGGGVEAGFNGLYFARERQHVDNNVLVDHAASGSASDQFYKGILDDRAHGVFAGKIVVRRDAQKTNAYQRNNNLLLSPEAEIDTKPELEIFADDVKCSHGATAGELDERELFYLRSRGLDPATARSVLTFAFAGEVLARFGHAGIAQQAKAGLLARLPGGPALGELA